MLRLGFDGEDLIAQVLTRASWTISARFIRRIGRERFCPDPDPSERLRERSTNKTGSGSLQPSRLDDRRLRGSGPPRRRSLRRRRLRRFLPRSPRHFYFRTSATDFLGAISTRRARSGRPNWRLSHASNSHCRPALVPMSQLAGYAGRANVASKSSALRPSSACCRIVSVMSASRHRRPNTRTTLS
jgi:hypothetical protein